MPPFAVATCFAAAGLGSLAGSEVLPAATSSEEALLALKFAPPKYAFEPFTNWDCVGVKGAADWDALYSEVEAGVLQDAPADGIEGPFLMPESAIPLLSENLDNAFKQCPLGTIYFLTLYTYSIIIYQGGETASKQSELLASVLRRYPFFVVAGARWPTFEALHHFSSVHEPHSPLAQRTSRCAGQGAGVDWDAVLAASREWSEEQLRGLEPGEGDASSGLLLKDAADKLYSKGTNVLAQEECPFGFVFLCATQVLAAAARLTGTFESWCRAVDSMLAELPFFSIAGSGWPTFFVLAMFSALSKGGNMPVLRGFQADVHRWGGVHPHSKRFRQYGDLRLLHRELSPLGVGSAGWEAVDRLTPLPFEEWLATVEANAAKDLRKVAFDALDASARVLRASALAHRWECGFSGIVQEQCLSRNCIWHDTPPASGPQCERRGPARKLVGVTFVWGKRWAPLVPYFMAWASRLRLSVIVVAMGEACRTACEASAKALGGASSSGLACWDPLYTGPGSADPKHAEHGSILQRHAIVHILLHLGVDVMAFDFDTFFFEDPRPRLEELAEAERADVLMTRHLDADCLNMGLLYVRASSRTAEWYTRYLTWLHQHPYEREQRGANALLGFTRQAVSFPPRALPPVRAVALDDGNEFASSRGGWLGDWAQLRFFHWVNPVETYSNWGDIKTHDLQALYEVALHPTTDLAPANGSLAVFLGQLPLASLLAPVRGVMESMMVPSLPERQVCW